MVSAPSSDTPTGLTLRLFGPLEAAVHGVPLPRLRSRTGYRLLALLVLRHDREVEREWLAGTLWPESSAAQASANLRETLKNLRHSLGAEASRLASPTRRTLRLDLSGTAVDLTAFDALVARGNPAALKAVVGLYRAPLLEGWTDEWVFQERQLREQAYLQALETLATRALADSDAAAADGYLRRAVAVDPLRETAQRALMQALAAGGNYAAAMQVYRDLRLRLHREINAEPDAETQALFQQLRAEAREKAGVTGERSGGRKRLQQPEHPFQLQHPSLPAEFSPVRSLEAFAHNLPVQMTSFITREEAMAEVKRLLGAMADGRRQTVEGSRDHASSSNHRLPSGACRLVTLTGAGGCGKTRLALQVAADLLEQYADGVWLVELASLSDPGLVPQTIASVLGVREEPGRPLTLTLIDALLPKKLLLILDNCEHLLGACAALADAILRRCPGVQILATSRERLNLAGETTYRVPSLSTPDLSAPPAELSTLTQYEAVRLFIDRALAVMPTFAVANENAPAVAEICHRLDGIPLAIELAAARVRVLSAEQIAARLDDRFRLLTGGSRAALPRQQTLRALIDWSYDLLTEPERTLLWRLSVFAGGWTLEAAEAVCSDFGFWILDFGLPAKAATPDNRRSLSDPIQNPKSKIQNEELLDLLTALVDKSLVAEEVGPEMRYRLLETVRQYSRERLKEAQEVTAVHERHCDWCLALAERAEPGLRGPAQAAWSDRLEGEHDNLRSALAWCVKGTVEKGLRLAGALAPFWEMRGYYSEGREHLTGLLALAGAQARTAARAKAVNGAGLMAFYEEDFAAARGLHQDALAIWKEVGDESMIAWSLQLQGWPAHMQQEDDAARAFAEEGLTIFRALGEKRGIAWSLNLLGILACSQRNYEVARGLFEESLAVSRETGDKRCLGFALGNLGEVDHFQGDHRAARTPMEESLAIFRELGDKYGIAFALRDLGHVSRAQGDYEAARALYEESLTIWRELGNRVGITASLRFLGEVAQALGEHETARALLEQSLALRRELGQKGEIAIHLERPAALAAADEESDRACDVSPDPFPLPFPVDS